jgi:hypothetical protein
VASRTLCPGVIATDPRRENVTDTEPHARDDPHAAPRLAGATRFLLDAGEPHGNRTGFLPVRAAKIAPGRYEGIALGW